MADDILEIIEIGLAVRLVEMGVERDAAERAVGDFIEETRESYGGLRYMIKRGYKKYSPRVISRIKKEYTGRNEAQLRARYGMSRTAFYNHIRKKSR
jgi:Mor family transcriptional regulator